MEFESNEVMPLRASRANLPTVCGTTGTFLWADICGQNYQGSEKFAVSSIQDFGCIWSSTKIHKICTDYSEYAEHLTMLPLQQSWCKGCQFANIPAWETGYNSLTAPTREGLICEGLTCRSLEQKCSKHLPTLRQCLGHLGCATSPSHRNDWLPSSSFKKNT